MEPKNLAELPLVFQVIAGLGLFFGTFMLAIGGWLWKTIKPKLPDALQPNETISKDLIIQSASIADSAAIGKLAHAIERLLEVLKDDGEDRERQSNRTHARLGDIADWLERDHEVLCRLERHMKERTIV